MTDPRDRFVDLLRAEGLVPVAALERCQHEASLPRDHLGNFPLVQLLIEQHLLEPSDVRGLLEDAGLETLRCSGCDAPETGLEQVFASLRPSFACRRCQAPLDFELGDDPYAGEAALTVELLPDELEPLAEEPDQPALSLDLDELLGDEAETVDLPHGARPYSAELPALEMGELSEPDTMDGELAHFDEGPYAPTEQVPTLKGTHSDLDDLKRELRPRGAAPLGAPGTDDSPSASGASPLGFEALGMPHEPAIPELGQGTTERVELGADATINYSTQDDHPSSGGEWTSQPTVDLKGPGSGGFPSAGAGAGEVTRDDGGGDMALPSINLNMPAWPEPSRPGAGGQQATPIAAGPGSSSGAAPAVGDDGSLRIGQIVDQRYVVEGPLRGFRGACYRVIEQGLGRSLALFLTDPRLPPERQHRSIRERDALQGLAHPAIGSIVYSGKLTPLEYLVTSLPEGRSLTATLRLESNFEPELATAIAIELADALAHLHERGVIHGALTSSSIWLKDDDDPAIIDLCLTPAERAPEAHAYMAPEVRAGQPADARADVFSLGALYGRMLSGRVPSAGEDPCSMAIGLPRRFGAVCRRAMARDPERRYASAEDLLDALELALSPPRDAMMRWVMAAILLLAVAGGFGLAVMLGDPGAGDGGQPLVSASSLSASSSIASPSSISSAPSSAASSSPAGAALLAQAREHYAAGRWAEALDALDRARRAGTEATGDLIDTQRELRLWRRLDGLGDTPEGRESLMRILLGESAATRAKPSIRRILSRAQMWSLKLTCDLPNATVLARPIDARRHRVLPGQPLQLGRAPLQLDCISDGSYLQIELRGRASDGGQRQLVFPLRFRGQGPRRLELDVKVEQIPRDMVLVPAASQRTMTSQPPASVHGFLIDQTEISRQRYDEAARRVGLPPLRKIYAGISPAVEATLPASLFRRDHAMRVAFALGRRLPTVDEWRAAAGALDGRRFPWGDDPTAQNGTFADGNPRAPSKTNSNPRGASPFGALNMFGNVGELVLQPSAPDDVLHIGGSYTHRLATIRFADAHKIPSNRIFSDVGMRCVRSLLRDAEGEPIAPLTALGHRHEGLVIEAARQLAQSGDPAALARLFAMAEDRRPQVREAMRFYVMQAAKAPLSQLLERALAGDSAARRRAALCLVYLPRIDLMETFKKAIALGDVELDRVLGPVVATIPQLRESIRAAALDPRRPAPQRLLYLAGLAHPDEREALRKLVADPAASVRARAASLLLLLGDKADHARIAKVIAEQDDLRPWIGQVGLMASAETERVFAAMLDAPAPRRRLNGAILLGTIGAIGQADKVVAAFEKSSDADRLGYLSALVELGGDPQLKGKRAAAAARARAAAIKALALLDLGRAEHQLSIIKLLRSGDPAVSNALMRRLDDPKLTPAQQRGGLTALLEGAIDATGQAWLEKALAGRFRGDELLHLLVAASGHPRARALLDSHRHPSAEVVQACRAILGDTAALDGVMRALIAQRQPQGQIQVTLSALLPISQLEAGKLLALLDHESLTVRVNAAYALQLRRQPLGARRLIAHLHLGRQPGVLRLLLECIAAKGWVELASTLRALRSSAQDPTLARLMTDVLAKLQAAAYRRGTD